MKKQRVGQPHDSILERLKPAPNGNAPGIAALRQNREMKEKELAQRGGTNGAEPKRQIDKFSEGKYRHDESTEDIFPLGLLYDLVQF
ncbi:hypothetical protein ACHAP8_009071 [Fusarium lateritium]